jgi:hypothetical protein
MTAGSRERSAPSETAPPTKETGDLRHRKEPLPGTPDLDRSESSLTRSWLAGDWSRRGAHELNDTGVGSYHDNKSQASSRVIDEDKGIIAQIGRLPRLNFEFTAPTAESPALADDEPSGYLSVNRFSDY